MSVMLHASDISAQARPLPNAQHWAYACMSEFFEQGDVEKQKGLIVSPQCDRDSANIPAAQVRACVVYALVCVCVIAQVCS